MGSTRRQFVKHTSAAAAIAGLAAVPSSARAAILGSPSSSAASDDDLKALAHVALDTARAAGASYADVRFNRNRTQSLFTREQRVQGLVDIETRGFGIRALVNGAWGFAASREVTRDEVARVARQAALQARANSVTVVRPGTSTMDEMIASTQRGLLVTRFWYLRPVDQRTILYTGLTRDGTFLIENGKRTRAVKNLRFNDSPVFMLNNLESLGTPVRVSASEDGGPGQAVMVPPMKVRDFNFTSLSDAV